MKNNVSFFKSHLKEVVAVSICLVLAIFLAINMQGLSSSIDTISNKSESKDEKSNFKNNENSLEDKENKVISHFVEEPVNELQKNPPPSDWVKVNEAGYENVGGFPNVDIKFFSSGENAEYIAAYLYCDNSIYNLGFNPGSVYSETFNAITDDFNNDGVNDLLLQVTAGAANVDSRIISYNSESGRWEQLLSGCYLQKIDLDNNGSFEVIEQSVGSIPSFVVIHRWSGEYFEKMDVSEATEYFYAFLTSENGNHIIQSGKPDDHHFYRYNDGNLIEVQNNSK